MKDNDANKQSGSTSVEKSGFINKYRCFEMALMGKDCKTFQALFKKDVLTFALPLHHVSILSKYPSSYQKFYQALNKELLKNLTKQAKANSTLKNMHFRRV